ncbi:MAG TPA: DUF423 domain-containing protein [Aromatoleum sp.]|uniref:DUF423 domain-containing protein n=1 Tax=Aromatoleum sp. TaxID=2307007 RepID=UPI002B46FB3B|nr:DUF423 domain-containing protein [Aromatoleum sp.]HJV27199.1 DUF423 domain-containing protein [Aromatoleum sp.]
MMAGAPARGRLPLLAGCVLAAVGIALGAFGAHGLRNLLGPAELGWWQTAVQYQMWNAVGLVGVNGAGLSRNGLPTTLLVAGTLVFAGTLYLMALTGLRWLGMITPIGGVLMIAGWLLVAWRVWRG